MAADQRELEHDLEVLDEHVDRRATPAREEFTGAGRPALPYSRPPSERRSP